MRTLVVGDVHGCAGPLARLLDLAGADRVVLVGDLYTRGPDPVGVWRLVAQAGADAVLGNHDARLQAVIRGERPDDVAGKLIVVTLDAADPAWRDHLAAIPLFRDEAGFIVVHAGLHPEGRAATTVGQAIAMRRYPGTAPDDPRWWKVYQGDQPVIFGHDAAQGLLRVERHGRPWILGLDSGCVYGGQLSGYLIEEDRLIQVASERVWVPVGRAP